MATLDKSNLPLYTISMAAKLTGASVHTLRLYENEGLIIPFKKASKQRLYSNLDIERLKCIRIVINKERVGIEGIRRMLALIPCWAIVKCTSQDRKNCKSFNNMSRPCWMANAKLNHCKGRICRECKVYEDFSNFDNIKENLKEFIVPLS